MPYRTIVVNDRIRVLDEKGVIHYAFPDDEEGRAKAETYVKNATKLDKERNEQERRAGMASGESIQAMSEEDRLRILAEEQEAIRFDSKDPASREKGLKLIDDRIDALEKIVREARLRIQVNATTKKGVMDEMSDAEKLDWREKSKKYKVKAESTGPKAKSEKPTGNPREKAIKSMAAALGCSYEEAEVEYEKRIASKGGAA